MILLRHGESEGNADTTLYRTKADNLIELTDVGTAQVRGPPLPTHSFQRTLTADRCGTAQAEAAGRRIRDIVGNSQVRWRSGGLHGI